MRIGVVASILALICLFCSPDSAFLQPKPEFRLGFQALAAIIPQIVGEPLDNEQHNPVNGDALQRTTSGLMVWRKADNWTAFTDGSRTWINGPLGIQVRRNDERFDWEIEPADLSQLAPSAPTPTPIPTPRQESSAHPSQKPSTTAATGPASSAVRSAEPAGMWVTSISSRTKYYTTKDNPYWKSWSPNNRVWFATEGELLSSYPGRVRK